MAPRGRRRTSVSIAWLYLCAGLGSSSLCILAIVTLTYLRPQSDNAALITQIVGFSTVVFVSMVGAIKGEEAKQRITELDHAVDGRLSELIAEVHERAKLEGRAEGAALTAQTLGAPTTAATVTAVGNGLTP